MLNTKEIIDKLYVLPEQFHRDMQEKNYIGAKHCYDTAREVAVFLNLDAGMMLELFGERGERGAVIRKGLFPEEQVQKAYLECIKINATNENKRYPGIPGRVRANG
ncbi:MAG: hypothetical protein NC313_17360 [Butyrivibrio sp.]|nr:hypothetical protein [Butyrivibrio sp.]